MIYDELEEHDLDWWQHLQSYPGLAVKVHAARTFNHGPDIANVQAPQSDGQLASRIASSPPAVEEVRRHLNCGTGHSLTIQTLRKPGSGASNAEIAKYVKLTEAAKKKRESDARNTQDDVGMRDVDEQQHPSPGTGQSEQQVRRHLNCGTRHPLTIQTLRKPGLGASHAEIAKYIKMTEAAKKKRESDARNTQDDVGMRDVDEQQHPSPGTGQSEQQVR